MLAPHHILYLQQILLNLNCTGGFKVKSIFIKARRRKKVNIMPLFNNKFELAGTNLSDADKNETINGELASWN
jgi:hypothetical protein